MSISKPDADAVPTTHVQFNVLNVLQGQTSCDELMPESFHGQL